MTTTFNAAATQTVGVNATNFEFTFTRLERIAFGPDKITTLGAKLKRMGRAVVANGKTWAPRRSSSARVRCSHDTDRCRDRRRRLRHRSRSTASPACRLKGNKR